MYRVTVDCNLGQMHLVENQEEPRGFLTIKFESGSEDQAKINAIARTKNLMLTKGFSPEEIKKALFSIEEIEKGDGPDDSNIEQSLLYYLE